MKLTPEPFAKIISGVKTIELRLNDEKRKKISIGDTIEFTNTADGETISVKVAGLYKFSSFAELYKALPLERCGYLPEEISDAHPDDMLAYYSAEKQKEYGVLGIEVIL